MLYEVVDPDERDERGVLYRSTTDAIEDAGTALEVWQLADDDEHTRMVRVWPDPEFEPVADIGEARQRLAAKEVRGLVEREAAALYAEFPATSVDEVRPLVALAFAKGYLVGFGECARRSQQALEELKTEL